jgi:hypothetical protein
MRVALLCVVVAACTQSADDEIDIDCTQVVGADTFVVGLEKVGRDNALVFRLLSATPAPPARYDNTWEVEISASGAPLDNAQLQVTPFMLKHEHVSAIHVESTMTEAGHYKLDHVNFSMPGVWETTIRASAGATTDSAVYKFCIE